MDLEEKKVEKEVDTEEVLDETEHEIPEKANYEEELIKIIRKKQGIWKNRRNRQRIWSI